MSVKLQITVTKEILEKARYCGFDDQSIVDNCAISVAVRDIFPNASTVYGFIYPFGVYDNEINIIRLPILADEFIKMFDRATPKDRINLPEISFDIEISDTIIEKINIDEIRPLLQNNAALKLIEN